MSVKYVFLTNQFYEDYAKCSEIEQKPGRPYVCILANVDGIDFAIPMRSCIKHKHSLITDSEINAGLDFSKAIVIKDKAQYIDQNNSPTIRQNEFNFLKGKEQKIIAGMERYISNYRKAKKCPENSRNANLLKFSTLQYFEDELGLSEN